MKNAFKGSLVVVSLVLTTACATTRTRTSDPVFRVTIDTETMSDQAYSRLQKALVKSDKFVVVDRSHGFKAIAHEQEIQHGTTRFGVNEKYALWGNMYGVGGIFIGTQQCEVHQNFWGSQYLHCIQNLSLVNATTGEVMAMSEVAFNSDGGLQPEWTDAVNDVVDNYPRIFNDLNDLHKTIKYDPTLIQYREQTIPQNSKKSMDMDDHDKLTQ